MQALSPEMLQRLRVLRAEGRSMDDVAHLAGVSLTTVRRYIGGDRHRFRSARNSSIRVDDVPAAWADEHERRLLAHQARVEADLKALRQRGAAL